MKNRNDLVMMLIASTVVFLVSLVLFYSKKASVEEWQVLTPVFMYVFNLITLWSLHFQLCKNRTAEEIMINGFKRSETPSNNKPLGDSALERIGLAVLVLQGVNMDGLYKDLPPDLADVVYYHWEEKMHMDAVASKLGISLGEACSRLKQAFGILQKGVAEAISR